MYGKRPIPTDYELHIPDGRYENMPEFIASLRVHEKPGQKKGPTLLAESSTSAKSKPVIKSKKTVSSSKTTAVAKKTYVVRKGDTLYSISRKFATSIALLREINNLSHNNIRPGQRLFVITR
jgi:LysM repeat protein